MASNTRGKLKEHTEGIHRNTEAIKTHLVKCLELIEDKQPQLTRALRAMGEMNDLLDKSAQKIYETL